MDETSRKETSCLQSDTDSEEELSLGAEETEAPSISAKRKKRIPRFSDSDSSSEKDDTENCARALKDNYQNESANEGKETLGNESSNDEDSSKIHHKSRLRKISSDSDSSKESDSISKKIFDHHSRMADKRSKLTQKFDSLLKSKMKEAKYVTEPTNESDISDEDDINKIKKKIKDRTSHLKSTIYDTDTSDEETSASKTTFKSTKPQKSTKLTSPKPIRMSAKEAMENMKKIKSESNRMLREKEVSLPYHRPKALSLKDIMSRRTPALAANGKALPIKMNEEQLKKYALQLEQRQKDIMELCKSESDENDDSDTEKIENIVATHNDSMFDDVDKDKRLEEKTDITTEAINIENKDILNNSVVDTLSTSDIRQDENISNATEADENEVNNLNNGLAKDKNTHDNDGKETTTVDDENNDNDDDIANVNFIIEKEHIDNDIIDSNIDGNDSAEISLVYNDSADDNLPESNADDLPNDIEKESIGNSEQDTVPNTELNSQLVSLHYDTEKTDTEPTNLDIINKNMNTTDVSTTTSNKLQLASDVHNGSNEFSDDDVNMMEIDNIIENAEILSQKLDTIDSPILIKDTHSLKLKPKLTGSPGMVIDLDSTDPFAPKKMSGIELLKERFTYFAKLKTPEELERQKEQRIKPGLQHLKLKQELEDKIAEQRSLEWAKRLADEKQQHKEMEISQGSDSEAEDDIDKLDAKLEEENELQKETESAAESEEEEDDIDDMDLKEKPRQRNPLVADEAEESDCDAVDDANGDDNKDNDNVEEEDGADDEDDDESEEESSDDESEEENKYKSRRGRILKAFEDSDDENDAVKKIIEVKSADKDDDRNSVSAEIDASNMNVEGSNISPIIRDTQDDELQLAQRHKSFSDDLFTSQESGALGSDDKPKPADDIADLGTQTFSILESGAAEKSVLDLPMPNSLAIEESTQNFDDNLDHVVGMCSGSFTQNLVPSMAPSQFNATSQTQEIGEDILALCTGKFYDNQFVSQLDKDSEVVSQDNVDDKVSDPDCVTNIRNVITTVDDSNSVNKNDVGQLELGSQSTEPEVNEDPESKVQIEEKTKEKTLLNSILDELNDPEFDKQKPLKYFGDDDTNKENERNIVNARLKKRFVIDSDEEGDVVTDGSVGKNKNKFKKKKMEQRALQISDDEEDEGEEIESEIDEDEDNEENVIGYDSEENEVVVQPEIRKKKRKTTEFFEQEAELTSEDEWVGSGDEDEAGLDRMEREAGDDDTFNQKQLQRELGQIHMRDVLDQDKREVRIIQELLFEDGDLGGGGRQRKFRWKNADGDEEVGTYCEFADTQEDEFESEEQWRKERHEREMFLKKMNQEETEVDLDVSVNRSTIIKANLTKSTTSVLLEVNTSKDKSASLGTVTDNKTKDVHKVPSPKKPFIMLQRNYHNSLLTRGQGALARLAALAIPLAGDDDTPKMGSIAPSSKRNFVFATLTPKTEKPKVSKRKAEVNDGTPRLVKKMKTEEKKSISKISLLDHIVT